MTEQEFFQMLEKLGFSITTKNEKEIVYVQGTYKHQRRVILNFNLKNIQIQGFKEGNVSHIFYTNIENLSWTEFEQKLLEF